MAEIVISIVAKVAELLVVPVGKHICYPFKYKTNMDELKKQVEKLTAARDRVQHSIEEAERQRLGIESDVKNWLNSVDEFTEGVVKNIIGGDDDEDEENKAKKLCAIGFCPNPMTRYSLSKKAEKTAKVGVDLLKEGKFEKVSYCPAIQRTSSIYITCPAIQRTNSIYIRGYNDFDSRTSIFQDIMQTLADDNVNIIGVHGMGGVGKTTLVKRVVGKVIDDKLFDVVVMADVTQTPNIQKIQAQIADELDLKFEVDSLFGRAARLRDRLKKEKRVLLVLDDLWKKLDLQDVGIPLGEGGNAEQRQCKLLLTSRDLHVLRDHMNTQKNFQLKILTDEEAGNLFWQIVGDSAKTSDFHTTGVEIIRRCAGLPVAIATIASALKNKSPSNWKDALDQLKMSNPRRIEGMEAEVYTAIKLSYDFLQSEEAKSVFLLCSLYNASFNIDIDYLLQYCIGLGKFQHVSTMEQARNRLQTVIDKLKASHLLLDGNTNMCVKMHDIVHAVAISIASTDKLMFNIQDVTDLKETLEEKLPKNSTAMSLPFKDVFELPERLEYPKLELLVLLTKNPSLKIPDPFFEGMEGLKVLHLNAIHLLSLPSSLCRLTSLQTLRLNRCLLGDIAVIGAMKRIEILSFLWSTIEQLPRELSQLTRLRLLDLRYCSKLKVISPNLISSLNRLEELYIGNSFVQWDVEGRSNASLVELKQLSRLKRLDICVLDARIIPQDLLIFEKLESYIIYIGDEWSRHDYFDYQWMLKSKLNYLDNYFESSRMLKLKLNASNIYLGNDFRLLLNRAEDLHLDELKGVKNVVYQLDGEGFPQLKHLIVRNGPEIQYIISAIGWDLCNVFPKLELLFLIKLVNLKKICHGQLAPESFNQLRIMKVQNCDTLNHLFSFSMVKNLSQLQAIEVTNCKKLEAIIFKESEEQDHQNDRISRVEFTQLRTLILRDLPRLTGFVFHLFTPNTESQEIVSEDQPRGFRSLFSQNVGFPSLEKMVISGMDNLKSIWHNQFIGDSFSFYKLKSVEVNDCQELKTIFPSCICGRLLRLESLTVKSCGSVIEIFDLRGINLKEKQSIQTTTQLRELYVDHMSNLKHIWNEDPKGMLSYGKLEKVTVFLCPNLEILFPASVAKRLLNLDSLEVSDCGVEEIILKGGRVKQLVPYFVSFQNLTTLEVLKFNRLVNLMVVSVAKSLVQLTRLKITECKMVEEIIITHEQVVEKEDRITFNQLKYLELYCLPRLASFCSGNYTIECPSLQHVVVRQCPNMKIFSKGTLITPRLHKLQITKAEDEDFWEGDLNTTIEKMFEEMIGFRGIENLTLSEFPHLKKVWHNQFPVSFFGNLKSLEVDNDCSSLRYIFIPSVALDLVQLQDLKINNCGILEAIMVIEEERIDNPLFPNLNRLELKDLPKLSRFCNFAGNSIKMPSLTQLWIENCPNMETFIFGSADADMPASKEILHTDIQPFFDEKVGFPGLEKMVVSGMDNLKSIWHNQFIGDSISFYKLKSVEVNDCQELKTIFPSCIYGRLLRLESLTVKSCGSVIEIFDLQGLNLTENHSIQTTQLRALYIDHLSNLKHIWNEDPKGMLSYRKLEKVTVFLCPNLEYLFPASAAKSLLNLDSLEVSDCGLEEIIAKEVGVKDGVERFLFLKLSSLQLHNLPRLRTFYPGHTAEGPCLKKLCLNHCDKVTLFISDFLGFYESIEGQVDISIHEQPPFFLVRELEGTKQGFRNLEELQLSGKAITMRWLSQVQGHIFCSLKSLELNDDESTVLPLNFIQRFGNLEKLSLNSSSYKEIFPYGVVNDKKHPQIKHLVLSGLFDLKQIWKQGSKIHLNFQNLEILEVRSCFNLTNLTPSSASFQKLMILVVWGCEGLKNLLTSSTAKSMVLLEKLEVFDCKMLTEVVANEGDVREEINFRKLKSLSLVYLQSLASFCSVKHILNFPILESLVVNECPKLKIFSEGVTSTSTPKLHKLDLNWKAIEHSWEVSVNTTIQQNMEKRLPGREDCTDPSTN